MKRASPAVVLALLLATSARADDDTRLPVSGFAPGDPGTAPASQPIPRMSGAVELRTGYGQRRGGQAQLAEAQLGAAFGAFDWLELATVFSARYLDPAARPVVLDPLQVQLKAAPRLRPFHETGAGFAVLAGARIPLARSGGDDRFGARLGVVTDERFSWGLLATVYAGAELRFADESRPIWAAVDLGLGFSFEIWRRIGLHAFVSGSARVPLTPLPSGIDLIPATATAGVQFKGPRQTFIEIGGCFDYTPIDLEAAGWCVFARLVATPGRERSLARFTRPEEPASGQEARRTPPPPSPFAGGPSTKAGRNLTGFPGSPGFNLKEAARDATVAVDLANRKYLGAALAERGMEAIYETLNGVVAGVTIGTVLLGVTIYYNASIELTALFLQWLGLGSLVTFGTEKLAQFGAAFEPFLRTIAAAHGDPAKIDQAAREYADAVALVTGAAGEALFFLAAANGLDPILKQLERTKFSEAFRPERLRAWLDEGVKRINARRAGAGALARPGAATRGASAPSASPAIPQVDPAPAPAPQNANQAIPHITARHNLGPTAPSAAPPVVVEPTPALTPKNAGPVLEHIRARHKLDPAQAERIERAARTKKEKWNLPDALRGEVSHALGGENLPFAYKGIDRVVRNARGKIIEVISIKSIQPYAKSYRQPGALYNKLKADIDALANPAGFGRSPREIIMNPTIRRSLDVEFPPDTIEPEVAGRPRGDPALRAQWRSEAAAAFEYARTRAVELHFKAVRR